MPPINSRSQQGETEQKPDYARIAQMLTAEFHQPGFPKENKPLAYALRFDGSISVVAANGMKFIFSKQAVDQEIEKLKSYEKAKETSVTKAAGRPRKPENQKKTG